MSEVSNLTIVANSPASGCAIASEASVRKIAIGRREHRRARRVVILLVGILLLSIADLVITLAHLQTLGMVEANPIARFIITQSQSSWGLVAYKMLTVTICVGLLFHLRHHAQGEIASWIGLLILVGLTVYWDHYTRHAHHPESITLQLNGHTPDERWLTLAN